MSEKQIPAQDYASFDSHYQQQLMNAKNHVQGLPGPAQWQAAKKLKKEVSLDQLFQCTPKKNSSVKTIYGTAPPVKNTSQLLKNLTSIHSPQYSQSN